MKIKKGVIKSCQSTTKEISVVTKLPNTEQSSKAKGKTHVNKQTKSVNNRTNGKTAMVQAFPKKWWVESDFTAPNLPLTLRLKGSG